ncbi:MAG TPA: HIT domain-containing protein [Phycisphaerae bacterium]|nr:HIT domain-containing protein [Phycisphaerae bacterium]
MAEFSRNLWAPWRMEYIRSLGGDRPDNGCFLCRYAATPQADGENHVIWRGSCCLTAFNSFPYNSGHLLVAPLGHVADLDLMDDVSLSELMCQIRDAKRLLTAVLAPQGFNIGMNFGKCAGAGLPGHLHVHIVPRWEGDTNFMPVVGDTRVIPESLAAIHDRMKAAAADLGLPGIRG